MKIKEKSRRGKNEPAINNEIRAREVRLIGEEGNQIGIVSLSEALFKAEEKGLDLVLINDTSNPPVCRLMNYSKYKYELQKKAKDAKKKQTIIKVKEIKFRPGTDQNDINIKVNHMINFFEEGNKVKVTIRFRGREMAHTEKGFEQINTIIDKVAEIAHPENRPKIEGRQMVVVFAPNPDYLKAKKKEEEEAALAAEETKKK